MKFTRDWEYPWTLLRGEAAPGRRLLDCGAGYSPLPFLWASRGAAVHAVDRDALVASKPRYLAWCVRQLVDDLLAETNRPSASASSANSTTLETSRRPMDAARRAAARPPRTRSRLGRFVKFHFTRNRQRLARLARPDFWGPVSPALLRRYGVAYVNADLTRLPFADGQFDAVRCVSVLEHMPRPARLAGIADMARVARPGGRLIVTYDVVDGDITDEIVAASGGAAIERVYFHASERLYAAGGPDVIGVVIELRRP
jgi:SAM-dependent methyltransferase